VAIQSSSQSALKAYFLSLPARSTPILHSAFQASLGDLAQAPPDVLAQYDLSKMDALKDIIDKLKDVR
jgi:hypothetical protein